MLNADKNSENEVFDSPRNSRIEATSEDLAAEVRRVVEGLYRTESRRVFATLVRLIGDFELAEDALQEAFAAAMDQWSREGVPANPRTWLVSTGRFKAIDSLRRRARFDASLGEIARRINETDNSNVADGEGIEDDRLRLIFTCCHPALPPNAQVALTLREVCGLKTEEIARAFLTSPTTIAQRVVRGKAKIRDAGIPYQVPSVNDLPDRLDSVLSVIYLVFNEGYSASSGESLTRQDLTEEAIRVCRLLVELLPDAEAIGLLALMLFQESRRSARTSTTGDLILLEDQDRTLWNRERISEGMALVERALASQEVGAYTIQAAIAGVHADARTAAETNWERAVSLYDLLLQINPSPVVELNRAVAVAMQNGIEAGLRLVDELFHRSELDDYYLAHSVRADFQRRLGRNSEAKESYERALTLVQQGPERRFLEKRLRELS